MTIVGLYAQVSIGRRCASLDITYVKTALQFAVTPQLDKDDLVQGQAYEIKGLVNRSPATFINISHYECVDR